MSDLDDFPVLDTTYYEPPNDEVAEIARVVEAAIAEVAATGESLSVSRILFRDKLKATLDRRCDPYVIYIWDNPMQRWTTPPPVPSLQKNAHIHVTMTIEDPAGALGRAYHTVKLVVPQWWSR